MQRLALLIFEIIATEFGPQEILRRLADPFWLQALGGLLGFDWHSSGLTVTTTSAVRYALEQLVNDVKIFPAGGKGKHALKTPEHIRTWAERFGLDSYAEYVELSKLIAKIDNAMVQDGYTIYHHFFVFDSQGNWVVIQQGMNTQTRYARRYHWSSFETPRLLKAIIEREGAETLGERKHRKVLNLSDPASADTREGMLTLVREENLDKVLTVLRYPRRESIAPWVDISPKGLEQIKLLRYRKTVNTFKDLLLTRGVGPKTLRALALTSHLLYGTPVSWKDPVKFTYAHGGKDGYPYKIKPKDYDKTIEVLHQLTLKLKDKKARNKAREILIKLTEV